MKKQSTSPKAKTALQLVSDLQEFFVSNLLHGNKTKRNDEEFILYEWLRDQGHHGGGQRYQASVNSMFNRGSINVSHVFYDDLPEKPIFTATALSAIVHPRHPLQPSVHIHISFTELRSGKSYWRIMADLNPAIEDVKETKLFAETIKRVAKQYAQEGIEQGNRYFYIPALDKHRGVCHFYLEEFSQGDFSDDVVFAKNFTEAVILCYCKILSDKVGSQQAASDFQCQTQLEYHTLYFFQVLTLDRGTTSGLLVHSQNDVGILGSLPSHVSRSLLASWLEKVEPMQQHLMNRLLSILPDQERCEISTSVKTEIAKQVRQHYAEYPEALLQHRSLRQDQPTAELVKMFQEP